MIEVQKDNIKFTMEPMWRTQDGIDISVSKMSDSHLENTINFIEGRITREANVRPDNRSIVADLNNIEVFQYEKRRRLAIQS